MAAHGTLERGLELSGEQVDHGTVVRGQVPLPEFRGQGVILERLVQVRHGPGLDLHPVDVHVQLVEQQTQELLRVLLVIADEPRREPLERRLERGRVDRMAVVAGPDAGQQVPVHADQLAVGPVRLVQHVLGQALGVAQALQNRVHVARVADVPDAHHPLLRVGPAAVRRRLVLQRRRRRRVVRRPAVLVVGPVHVDIPGRRRVAAGRRRRVLLLFVVLLEVRQVAGPGVVVRLVQQRRRRSAVVERVQTFFRCVIPFVVA